MHTALSVLVVLTLLVLRVTGVISTGTAVLLFLAVELPLLLVFFVLTVMRFRQRDPVNAGELGFLEHLESEEPLLRPFVSEMRTFGSLFLLIRGKRLAPSDSTTFGYNKGAMTLPLILVALSVGELAVVHVIVPWTWLRITLLVLTVWGMLFIGGFFAHRVVYPHFIAGDTLHLRWGRQTVLITDVSNIASATLQVNYAHTQPHAEGTRLILTQLQSTNVLIRFAEPVAAAAPVSKKTLPADFHATEVELYLDDPDSFLRLVRSTPEATS